MVEKIQRMYPTEDGPAKTKAVAATDLSSEIDALRDQMQGCGQDKAAKCGEMLIGCYPNARMDAEQAEVYSAGIVSVLREYPAKIAAKAVDRLTRTLKFPPTRAEVYAECERLIEPQRSRIDRLVTQRHVLQEAAALKQQEADRQASLQRFKDSHDGRTPLEVIAELREQGVQQQKDEQHATTSTQGNDETRDPGRSGGSGQRVERGQDDGDIQGSGDRARRGSNRDDVTGWGSRIPASYFERAKRDTAWLRQQGRPQDEVEGGEG